MKTNKIFPSVLSHSQIYKLQSIQGENQPSESDVQPPETKCQIDAKEHRSRCRYVIVFVGFLVFFQINAYRMNMSVNIVAMVNRTAISLKSKVASESCPHLIPNATTPVGDILKNGREDGEFAWSPTVQGYVLGSLFLGYAITQIPSGILSERFGCKWILFTCSFVTAVCTFLIPLLSRQNASAVTVLQTLRGLAQGFIHPASSILTANWFPRMERGILYSCIMSGSCFGGFLGSLFSGFLCASFGRWPSSFYTFGGAGLIISFMVLFFVHESPKDHPKISKSELHYILSNQESALSKRRPDLPWSKMLTSVPVYALLYAVFGQQWSLSIFYLVQATFLGTILHYPIAENGFFTAVPFLLQFAAAQLGCWLSSYLLRKKFVTIDRIRKFWNFMASLGSSAFLLGVYIAGCNRNLSSVFAIFSTGFAGFGYAGSWIVSIDMTPTFSGTLNALCLMCGSVGSVFIPLIVGYLTNEMQTIEQWNKVFFISIGIIMSSGIVFAVFGSAEVQPWNFVEDEELKEEKEVDKTRF